MDYFKYLLLGLTILITCSVSAEQLEIKIAVASWLPYNSSPGEALTELEQSVKDAIETEGGFRVKFVRHENWADAMDSVRRRECYFSLPWIKNNQRLTEFTYLRTPIIVDHTVVFCRRDRAASIIIKLKEAKENIKQLKIAGITGYAVWNEKYLEEINFKNLFTYETQELAFSALSRGDVDLVSESIVAGFSALDRYIESESFEGKVADFICLPISETQNLELEKNELYMIARKSRATDPLVERIDNLLREEFKMVQGVATERIYFQRILKYLPSSVELTDGAVLKGDQYLPVGSQGIALNWYSGNKSVEILVTSGPARGSVILVDAEKTKITGLPDLTFYNMAEVK